MTLPVVDNTAAKHSKYKVGELEGTVSREGTVRAQLEAEAKLFRDGTPTSDQIKALNNVSSDALLASYQRQIEISKAAQKKAQEELDALQQSQRSAPKPVSNLLT